MQGRRVPKDSLLLLHWHAAHALEDAAQRGRGAPAVFKSAKAAVLDREYLQEVGAGRRRRAAAVPRRSGALTRARAGASSRRPAARALCSCNLWGRGPPKLPPLQPGPPNPKP